MLDESQLQIVPLQYSCRTVVHDARRPDRPVAKNARSTARETNDVDGCDPLKLCFITNLSRLRLAPVR
jgi:hypothetical protein